MSPAKRACDSCSACCTAIAVPELAKGTFEPCRHLRETGCGIYAERPEACRAFECQWLRGLLEVDGVVDLELRPNACGVIFDYQPDSAFGELYTAWEVEPGASARGPARGIVEGLAERFLVLIITPDSDRGGHDDRADGREGATSKGVRRFVGPRHLVTHATDLLWSRGTE